MTRVRGLALIALLVAAIPATATAQQPTRTRFELQRREEVPADPDQPGAPRYERLVGRLHHALDPESECNARIVDLQLAVRGEDGLIHTSSDLEILQATDPERRRGLLLEVCNRGGKAALRYLQRAGRDRYGDRLLMRRGLGIAWVGWQHDVPQQDRRLRLEVPGLRERLTGEVRCDWTLSDDTARLEIGHRSHTPYPIHQPSRDAALLTWRSGRDGERRLVDRDAWRFSADGLAIEPADADAPRFLGGHIYELVYTATDPVPVGLGLAAIRDAATYCRDAEGPFATPKVVALGISQTGRFLRHFVWQGFTSGSDGAPSLDGILALTAGAGRGSFNHRFAQPSRDAHRNSAFFYPTDIFPFTSATQTDPVADDEDGLFAHQSDPAHLPRIFWINTGYEYWGRSAALIHVSVDGERDVPLHPSERIYHLAGCQHYQSRVGSGSPIEMLSIHRALTMAMFDWVIDGREPPASRYPRVERGELVPVDELRLPMVPGLRRPAFAHTAYRADYGPGWARGIIAHQPPLLGPTFPCLVPQCDELGRELGGYWPPELHLGLGVFTGWSLPAPLGEPGTVTGEIRDFVGAFHPFPAVLRERIVDQLPEVDAVLDRAIEQRFLLDEDRERLRRHLDRVAEFAAQNR